MVEGKTAAADRDASTAGLIAYLRQQNYGGSLTVELTNWKYNVDPTRPLRQCVSAMRAALGPAPQ